MEKQLNVSGGLVLELLPTEKAVLSLFRRNFPNTKQAKTNRFDLKMRFYTLEFF